MMMEPRWKRIGNTRARIPLGMYGEIVRRVSHLQEAWLVFLLGEKGHRFKGLIEHRTKCANNEHMVVTLRESGDDDSAHYPTTKNGDREGSAMVGIVGCRQPVSVQKRVSLHRHLA